MTGWEGRWEDDSIGMGDGKMTGWEDDGMGRGMGR